DASLDGVALRCVRLRAAAGGREAPRRGTARPRLRLLPYARTARGSAMFRDHELVAFSIAEFRRGLEGLTPEEALVRHPKADGTTVNAISWTVMHVGNHWWNVARAVRGDNLERLAPTDGT